MANDLPDFLKPYDPRSGSRPPAPSPRNDDWLARQVRSDMQAEQTKRQIMQAPPPDVVATQNKVQRATGIPPLFQPDPALAERSLQADKTAKVLGQYPSFTRWGESNPRGVVAASDDADALGKLGKALDDLAKVKQPADFRWRGSGVMSFIDGDKAQAGFQQVQGVYIPPPPRTWRDTASDIAMGAYDFVRNSPTALEAGLYEGGAGLRASIVDPLRKGVNYINLPFDMAATSIVDAYMGAAFGTSSGHDPFKALEQKNAAMDAERVQMRTEAQRLRETYDTKFPTVRTLLGGTESVTATLMGIPAFVATRNPEVLAVTPGLSVGGNAYDQARVQGLGIGESAVFAGSQMSIEIATEKLPARYLGQIIEKMVPLGKGLAKEAASEIYGEQVATALQDLNEWSALPENSTKTFADYVAARPGAAADTLIATIGGFGAQNAIVVGGTRGGGLVLKVVGKARDAVQAKRQAAVVDRAAKASTESALRRRDPEAFRDLMREAAQDSGATHVFIPGDKAAAYLQSDGFDAERDPFARYAPQVADAVATGGDVVIPVEDALTDLAGSPAWGALSQDMRLSGGGVSLSEAEEFNAEVGTMMQDIEERMSAQEAENRKQRTAIQKLTDSIAEKLGVSYASPQARTMAELGAAYYATRAARLGREVTGDEFGGVTVRQVMGPELAAARAADATDLVINAMRRGKDATKQGGKSLLDWIAARGGVEDVGGDIASMGGDKWHRGKVGKRKLIKPSNTAQGNMIGGADNPNTLERTFDAAISEGYFPDLLARREDGDGYADKVDVNDFLAAIGDELAGRPTYAEEARVDPYRAAAQEAEALLADAGYSPSEMTDQQIRDALDSLTQEATGMGYEQLPDTLDIDGVERPTRNSEGMPLAGSADGVRAFWKWFGDSKVVDEEGRPLVVYHGTAAEFEAFSKGATPKHIDLPGFYFTPSADVASRFAESASRKEFRDSEGYIAGYEGAAIVPAYLSIQNMTEIKFDDAQAGKMTGAREVRNALVSAEKSGSDGAIIRGWADGSGDMQFVAFSPTQIKSINNRGTFAADDARILYQRTGIDLTPGGGSRSVKIGNATIDYGVSSNGETAEVILVKVPQSSRRKGEARAAMAQFLAATDEAGLTVFLTAHPMGKGGASKSALDRFYKSLGFVENKGRNKDFRAMQGMVRQSRQARSFNQAAYHGSPHIFDRFSLDYMGTGEGAQAYGWGLYFTDRKEIADHYRSALAEPTINGREMRDVEWGAWDKLQGAKGDVEAAIAKLETRIAEKMADGSIRTFDGLGQQLAVLRHWQKEMPEFGPVGRTYQVDIPEDGEFLLWDKPLSEQPAKVKAAIEALNKEGAFGTWTDGTPRDLVDTWTGSDIYHKFSEMKARLAGRVDADEGNGWAVVNPTVHYDDKAASLALLDAGIAGIKFLDGGSRSQGDGTFNYVVFDDSRVSITAYEQEARARIQFNEGQTLIELFQSRNLSSFLHEFGHLTLENLRADASLPDAPESLKADWEAVKAWFAENNVGIGEDGAIPVEAHELWARGTERFVMEGKAPSTALQRVFETIRSWLVSIYKTVEALRSPITPEIREVMARLYATQEEIDAMRERQNLTAILQDAKALGMTEPEMAAYQRQVENARTAANSALVDKTLAAVRRREEKRYREARNTIRDEVRGEVNALPIFRALDALKTQPVSEDWLREEMGEDVFSLLPKRVPPIYRQGGIHPDTLAEMTGFATGRQMVEALIGAEIQHRQLKEGGDQRTMRDRETETRTDAEFGRRYGDPLNDGSIEREALAAVHNDMQGEVIATELRVLARSTGKRATPYAMARDWARGRVRGGKVSEEASAQAIQRYARNAAKAGKLAEKAMLERNADEAFRQKQLQMLNNALVAEAKAARDEVEAAVKRMGRIAERRTMDSVDQDYLEQAQALLEAVDLRKRSQLSIDRKLSFEKWAEAKRAEGIEVFVPERFDYSGTPWSRMTVESLLGLDDTIKSIMHLGRRKQTLLDRQKQREFEDWRDEARMGLEEAPGRKVTTELGDPSRPVAGIFSNLMKMEVFAAEMDNDRADGAWQRLLVQRATEAANYRDEQRNRTLIPIAAAYQALSRKARNRLSERFVFQDIPFRSADINDPRNGTPLEGTRWDLVGMALNLGTESNLDKLARGFGVSPSTIEGLVTSELTAEEWQFVQTAWSSLGGLWPDIAKAEREMQGVEPEKVAPRTIETPFGVIQGDYYPVVYDPSFSQRAEDNLKDAENDLFGNRSGVATSKGHTVSRTDYAAPLLLSPERVIFQHVEKVVTRNAYGPWIRDVLKATKDASLRALIDRKFGPEFRQQIEPWLKAQVREGMTSERATHWAEKFLRSARVNTTIVSMGLRWSTGVAQTVGLANSAGRIGVNNLRRGYMRMLANPKAAWEFISARSPEMTTRNEAMNRDVSEAFREMRRLRIQNGAINAAAALKAKANAYAFWHIGMVDRWMVSAPTWLGAYEQAIRDGLDDTAASAYADKMVRLSQGSGREKDLSAWQSSQASEGMKFLTMFYTPFNVLLNAQWEAGRAVRRGDWRKAAMTTFWFMVATPLLDALVAGDTPDDDDEEGWAQWLARNIGFYLFAGIPVLRDVGNYAERKVKGDFATFNPGPLARIFGASEGLASDVIKAVDGDEEASNNWVRHAIEAPGYFVGLPTGQVSQTAQFLWDVSNGDTDPQGFWDWYTGLTKGKLPEN